MLPEQEQRILGYFIEEAKDHLNAIEQGLLNLQNTLKNPEMINEIFRAAHSVKGGAAMLGLDSIQQTAHRLEDCFKVLQECPTIQVDQKLETLFLQVFDTLQDLLEQLQGSSCVKDVVNNRMSEMEPVFEALNQHLELLVNQARGTKEDKRTPQVSPSSFLPVFQSDVLQQLREMLQMFKQPETQKTRQQLQECCNQLVRLGEQFNLPGWCNLCKTASGAIANVENKYHTLAPIVIKELKQSQELVLADREAEITTSKQLQALCVTTFTCREDTSASVERENDQVAEATLAFDSLFDSAKTIPLEDEVQAAGIEATKELDFGDLFDTPEESEESLDHRAGEIDSEEFCFSSNKSENLFEESLFTELQTLAVNELEAKAASDSNVQIDDFLSEFLEEFSSTFDDTLGEQPNVDLTLVASEQTQADFSEDLFDIDMALDNESDVQAIGIEAMPGETGYAIDKDSAADVLFDLEAQGEVTTATEVVHDLEDFADWEALLGEEATATPDEFAQAEALLELNTPSPAPDLSVGQQTEAVNDEFGDLEKLLEEIETPEERSAFLQSPVGQITLRAFHQANQADMTEDGSAIVKPNSQQAAADLSRPAAVEQMMRVSVKHLDNVSNLVGELVVYRNSLEQDQQRLRQFLDNLLHQVHQLSDVGSRMQELYERSLLEASLLNRREDSQSAFTVSSGATEERHATGINFDALEMDRFTGFHTISQEMIELIVRVRESSSDIEFITDEAEQVARQFRQVTTQLQEGLTRSRMVPFAQIAERLPRAVRDIGLKYGKQAELHIEGRETLIDKVILEQLYDPMTHLVNNAITHGIEPPEQRSTLLKSPVGQITIRAFHQGNQTVISIADDGAGIDPEQVKAKAIQKGLITSESAKTMSRLDLYNLLFHPGFSTKDQVDEFAGRGIGMDVVRTSLSQIRGAINTDSTLGLGTTFTIRLPLTLSICKALCCLSDKARIAFPMDGVEHMMDVPASSVLSNAEGQSCIPWRDSLLPFRPLKELLTYNRHFSRGNVYGSNRKDDMISIVVIRSAGTFIALQVDQVLGEQEIVIKQFEGPAPKPVGVAGATVMGDGRIMPIADVLELIDLSMGRTPQEAISTLLDHAAPVLPEIPGRIKTEPTVLIIDDSITVRELLSMTFNKAGYRVEQARDGQEAWEKLRDGLPCDIVFCDIEMPRMDGLELLSRMQKDPSLSQLPIAMLTSRGSDRHRQMAVQLGANGYFTKPYLEEALLDGAQRMLRGEILVTTNSNA